MMNGIVAWWGKNPVAGNLLMVAIIAAGLFSFWRMDKEFQPPWVNNSVQVSVSWPGASPEDMERQVTVRVEEALAGLDGVDWVRSRSMEGFAWVNVSVDDGYDLDAITAEVRSRVDSVSGLPPGIEPPRVVQNIGRNWSIIFSVHGDVDERTLQDAAERVRDRLALVPGGANTTVMGRRQAEISIELSEEALRRYGLTFDEVARAIRSTSVNVSGGSVRTPDGDFQLRARNLAETDVDFSQIIIRQTPEGATIRVGDVARVVDGYEDRNVYTRSNGERSLLVSVLASDQHNILTLSPAVDEAVGELRRVMPAGVEITKIDDERENYENLIGILFSNAVTGFILIFVLLLLTLHPMVALWATLGVITAFTGAFIVLPYIDISLNFMSVFGFLLVLGIMVDDAIIVGEAIYERVERGERGADAAILATQLVLKPLIASVMTTALAFWPFMMMGGEVRQFFQPLSIVVMSALFFSLVESLIILPAHLTKVQPLHPGPSLLGRLAGVQVVCANSVIWFANHVYAPTLRFCMRFRYATLASFVVAFALGVALVATGRVGQAFMPEIESDFMQVSIEMPRTTPFGRMVEVAEQLDAARSVLEADTADLAVTDPNTGVPSRGVIRSWTQSIDETQIQAWVGLTSPADRPDMRSKEITEKLKALMGPVPDAERLSFELSGNNSGPMLQIALLGDNQEQLRAAVEELKEKLIAYDAVTSVRDSEEAATEEVRFTLKPGAEQLGLTLAMVSNQVRQAYFGEEVQRTPRNGEEVRVWVRYPQEDRRTLASLEDFHVRTPDGRAIPLAQVADVDFAPGVTGLDRRQRMRSIMVEAEGDQEGRAKIMEELNAPGGFFETLEQRYPGVSRRALGQAEAQAEFFGELLGYGLLALFGMYALLAITFRSYGQPGLIMSVIPFAVMGAAIGHFIFDMNFALFSWLGMVAAMGVIVNDNVVLVDKANQLMAEGEDEVTAITDAGISRFRQIFLTSITEFVGLAPMLFEMAVIAQFLKPMAVSLAFGVLLAMPATLLLTPVLAAVAVDIKQGAGGVIGGLKRAWGERRASATPAE